MSTAVAGLQCRDLLVCFGQLAAVDGVDLDVAPGEILALLGASGSGKSSLLRGIAGLEPLSGGRVTWDGIDVTATPVHRRGFGVMFQDGQLFPHRTVGGNVAYGLVNRSRGARLGRVNELLDLVGLTGYADRAIATLSGGQAQRVALARSLAPHPRLLLLDEPLSALDRELRERLVTMLGDSLRATRTTSIYVTHDQDEAFAVADRIAVMAAGRIVRVDTPRRLWADPGSLGVARFLGYGPFLDAPTARALGWLGPLDVGHLVAIGPDGLIAESGAAVTGADAPGAAALSVPVSAQVSRRGGTLVHVRLPHDIPAIVATAEPPTTSTLRVRLDPSRCAVVPADDAR